MTRCDLHFRRNRSGLLREEEIVEGEEWKQGDQLEDYLQLSGQERMWPDQGGSSEGGTGLSTLFLKLFKFLFLN